MAGPTTVPEPPRGVTNSAASRPKYRLARLDCTVCHQDAVGAVRDGVKEGDKFKEKCEKCQKTVDFKVIYVLY
jgi:hypothetical protein